MGQRVILLSRPCFDDSYQEMVDHFLPTGKAYWRKSGTATAAEHLVEFAGRVCYMAFGPAQSPKTTTEYIHHLIRSGHDSVLEHATWSFAIFGVTRAFTHQLVRHRVGFSFSQLSQQYHDESEAKFVRPAGLDMLPDAAALWDKAVMDSQKAYRQLLVLLAADKNILPQKEAVRALRSAARSVLPNATETAIVVTANARAVRHFLKERGGIVGDAEMRLVSAALLEVLRPEGPALFSDFTIEHPGDGMPLVVHLPMR